MFQILPNFFCLLGLLQMRRFFSSEFYLCFFFSEGAFKIPSDTCTILFPALTFLFVRRKFRAYGCCITLILLMFVFTLCVRRTSRASACWILPFLSFIFEGLVTKTWRATLSYGFGFCSQISSSLMRDPCQSGQVLDVNAQCHLLGLCIPIQLEIG